MSIALVIDVSDAHIRYATNALIGNGDVDKNMLMTS